LPTKNKRYGGYRSYSYLEAGRDYRPFDLAPELGRVPEHTVEVDPEQEARARRLLEENIVVSLHDHPTLVPADLAEIVDYRRQGREFTAYEALSRSYLDAVFDNMMDGTAVVTSKNGWKWDDIVYDLGMRLSDLAHQDFIVPCRTVADIRRAKEEGRLAWVAALEAATPIENELDRIDILYGLGVRLMGVAYSESNTLGSGLREPVDGGLTRFGREAVRRMNRLGMAIDVSHAGDRTALDTIEVSDKPVFITHAGARVLWPTARMKPDEVIRACAEKGGVIGIEAAPHTTLTHAHPRHSIESVMEHFEYCVQLVGIDHVAFGPDTLYGDHVGLHHAFAGHLSIASAHQGPAFEEVPYVAGIENPTEAFPNIVRWLVRHGYGDEDIAKVIGKNALRVLEAVWFEPR
jgi:membrane dipeptidase